MTKKERNYTMYMQAILVAMTRIAEYLEGYDFDQFKKDHKTVDAVIRNVCINHLPENRKQIKSILNNL